MRDRYYDNWGLTILWNSSILWCLSQIINQYSISQSIFFSILVLSRNEGQVETKTKKNHNSILDNYLYPCVLIYCIQFLLFWNWCDHLCSVCLFYSPLHIFLRQSLATYLTHAQILTLVVAARLKGFERSERFSAAHWA